MAARTGRLMGAVALATRGVTQWAKLLVTARILKLAARAALVTLMTEALFAARAVPAGGRARRRG